MPNFKSKRFIREFKELNEYVQSKSKLIINHDILTSNNNSQINMDFTLAPAASPTYSPYSPPSSLSTHPIYLQFIIGTEYPFKPPRILVNDKSMFDYFHSINTTFIHKTRHSNCPCLLFEDYYNYWMPTKTRCLKDLMLKVLLCLQKLILFQYQYQHVCMVLFSPSILQKLDYPLVHSIMKFYLGMGID